MKEKIIVKLIEKKLEEYLDRFSKNKYIEEDITKFSELVKEIRNNSKLVNNKKLTELINKSFKKIIDIKRKTHTNELEKILKEKQQKLAEERRKTLLKHLRRK